MVSTTVTIISTVAVVLLILVILAVIYLIWREHYKKWKCTEGGCEFDIDGDYTSKSECLNACKQKQEMMSTMENDELDAWACTVSGNNYQCIRSDEGEYTSQEACQKNCSEPSYYYPQTMLYRPINIWDRPRRPRYWWPRSGRRRSRRHSPCKKII